MSINFLFGQFNAPPDLAQVSVYRIDIADDELGKLSLFGLEQQLAAVLVNDYVVAYGKAKSGALAGRLRRKEWVENFLANLGWNAVAVVANADFDFVAEIFRAHGERRGEGVLNNTPLAPLKGGMSDARTSDTSSERSDLQNPPLRGVGGCVPNLKGTGGCQRKFI